MHSEALVPVSDGKGSVLALLLYLQLHALDVVHHVSGVFGALSNNVAPNEWLNILFYL